MLKKLFQDLMIVWLVADNVISDEAIAFLEIDDLRDELIDLDLLDVDVDDKKQQDAFSLNVLDEMLLAFEELRRDVLGVGDCEVVRFDVDEGLDQQRLE